MVYNKLPAPANIMPFPDQITDVKALVEAQNDSRLVQIVYPFWVSNQDRDDFWVMAKPGGTPLSLRDIAQQISGSALEPEVIREEPSQELEDKSRLVRLVTEPLGILAVGSSGDPPAEKPHIMPGETPLVLQNRRRGFTQEFAAERLNIPPPKRVNVHLIDPYAYLRVTPKAEPTT